ncbi:MULTISPECIES: hypothetical protein [Acetobacter]|uniref:Uncharacterized protein n=2 Tax=Acetobacter TaxID=434 RepID=A0AAN1PK21_9PROT|nr:MULTISPECIES: hypothetical protein [Acetobacter]ASL39317.1 hypothetical protein CBI36_01895 [Acetobacter oryzifermentans]AXN01444.1 hypothetical protein CJF59_13460 [Acetobacter pomorum]KAA8387620.1 hypothetical protein FKW31_02955 [Acetobacter sp. DmW_136]KAA8397164.1 hypothetical protein FKW22_05180 [Acetobacter sp. DmW_125124]KAA8397710.1 hypothetical protein FKW20_08610 [Acetobacter sp. DmW_125127]
MTTNKVPPQRWARVENGVVVDIRSIDVGEPAPWRDGRAIRVTGVPCEIGFIVDHHGNVAPRNGGRTLSEGEAAYSAPRGIPAPPSGAVSVALAAANVHLSEDEERQEAEHAKQEAGDGQADNSTPQPAA